MPTIRSSPKLHLGSQRAETLQQLESRVHRDVYPTLTGTVVPTGQFLSASSLFLPTPSSPVNLSELLGGTLNSAASKQAGARPSPSLSAQTHENAPASGQGHAGPAGRRPWAMPGVGAPGAPRGPHCSPRLRSRDHPEPPPPPLPLPQWGRWAPVWGPLLSPLHGTAPPPRQNTLQVGTTLSRVPVLS